MQESKGLMVVLSEELAKLKTAQAPLIAENARLRNEVAQLKQVVRERRQKYLIALLDALVKRAETEDVLTSSET